ncbi:MAG: Asp-tRNA(Asn)/Glu-tRNA(Gln) amidotransferase subunit GatC [Anaerolineales bacterium]
MTYIEKTYALSFCPQPAHVIILNMSLSLREVEHVAELSRLKLTEAEKRRYREQLSEILDYVARLQSIDTSQTRPTFEVATTHSRLRPDIARPGLSVDELLKNAPEIEQNQFRIPPVLD